MTAVCGFHPKRHPPSLRISPVRGSPIDRCLLFQSHFPSSDWSGPDSQSRHVSVRLSPPITNYNGCLFPHNKFRGRKTPALCQHFEMDFGSALVQIPSKHPTRNLSPLCTVTFRIFALLFSFSFIVTVWDETTKTF